MANMTQEKATVEVQPLVRAGLDKGGEDLFLVFTCVVNGELVPDEFDVELDVDDDTYGYNVELLDEEAEDDIGRVKFTTWHYEITWEGDADDARHLIEEYLHDNKRWYFCHHPGEPAKLRFHYEHYVGGNAD